MSFLSSKDSRLNITPSRVVDDPIITELAHSLNKSPAQLLISWAVQRGTAVVPKSVTPARIASNFEGNNKLSSKNICRKLTCTDFILPDNVFNTISSLERHLRMNNPVKTGVDVFGEVGEENARRSAREWAEAQRCAAQVT